MTFIFIFLKLVLHVTSDQAKQWWEQNLTRSSLSDIILEIYFEVVQILSKYFFFMHAASIKAVIVSGTTENAKQLHFLF